MLGADTFQGIVDHPKVAIFWSYFYKYFLRYFLDQEVGHGLAILNGMLSTFAFGFLALWAMKGWGLTSWNRNLIKNKKRFVAIALRRLKEELAKEETPEKVNERKKICSLDFEILRGKLQKGELTAEQVVDAYRCKAIDVHEKYNCATDFVKEAADWARELDAKYKGKPKPALFGIPFSVKDNFYMSGYDATSGLAKNVEDPKTETSVFVSFLRSIGAIPIVRTNVPQTMLSFACSNPTFGSTKNPHNLKCTPGGSSGGESCLIASGGCPFGIGTDIAGSLRIPSHFCGTVSLKPCENRIRDIHLAEGAAGVVRMGLSVGFITKDVKSQIFLWSVTLVDEFYQLSPYTVPLPFRAQMADFGAKIERPLPAGKTRGRIGYYLDDGFIEAVPACRRAVEVAADVLKESGYELVRFTVPDSWNAYRLTVKALFSDNFKSWLESLDYEDVDEHLKDVYRASKIPLSVRYVTSKILGLFWPRVGHVAGSYTKDLHDLRSTFASIKQYRNDFAQQVIDQNLDAVIGPAFTFPAISYPWSSKLSCAFFYTALYNLLDLPAGVVPVTRVNSADVEDLDLYPRSLLNGQRCESFSFFRDPFYCMIRQAVQEAGEGLPVAVQVATLPFKEETCLKIMAHIEKGVDYKQLE